MDIKDIPDGEGICYSGFFIDKTPEFLLNWVSNEFKKSSDIKNLKKKKDVQAILEKFSLFFEGISVKTFQFFINVNFSKFVSVSKTQFMEKDKLIISESFEKEYWEDFYNNQDFKQVYRMEKKLNHWGFTKTKLIKYDNLDLEKFDGKYDLFLESPCNLNVKMISLEKSNNFLEALNLTWEKKVYGENEELLKKVLVELERNPDLFIFGQEIIKEIKNFGVKEIYCLIKFRDKISQKMDKELLNFKWILFPNDFEGLNNYQGILGKRYFI